ncbi:MAG: helix-turn-helix domain-containing protein [Myxococcales bacterium]|nr:helix-turn-helix domain-containing protein [Myxococcales bacterium]
MTTEQPLVNPSPGATLAGARVRAGITLAEVARRSRVPPEALDALERDDWASLPAPVYARGFLRLYARELGLDPEPLVTLMDAQRVLRGDALVPRRPRQRPAAELEHLKQNRRGTAVGVALGALIVVFLLSLFGRDELPVDAGTPEPPPAGVSVP